MPEPQLSFSVVAKNASGKVFAEVALDMEKVAKSASSLGSRTGPSLNAFQTLFVRMGGSATAASKGVNLLEGSLRGATNEALALDGPFSKALQGVVALGGPEVVAAAGVVSVIALAVREATKETREWKEQLTGLQDVVDKALKLPDGFEAIRAATSLKGAALGEIKALEAEGAANVRSYRGVENVPDAVREGLISRRKAADDKLRQAEADLSKLQERKGGEAADALITFWYKGFAEKQQALIDYQLTGFKGGMVDTDAGRMMGNNNRFLQAVGFRGSLTLTDKDRARVQRIADETAGANFRAISADEERQEEEREKSRRKNRFGRLSGGQLGSMGLDTLFDVAGGGGFKALVEGGLGVAGGALFGPFGASLGKGLGKVLGGWLGKQGPSKEELALKEQQRTNAILEQQLKIMEDQKNFQGAVVLELDDGAGDPISDEALARRLRNLSSKRVIIDRRQKAAGR